MRKETYKIAKAFLEGRPAKASRTSTDGQTVWLHGNRIAYRDEDGHLCITMAGWPTVTTRERLNGILSVFGYWRWGVAQRNYDQYLINPEGGGMLIGDRDIIQMEEHLK